MNKLNKFSPERLEQIQANIIRICINEEITKQFLIAAQQSVIKYKNKERLKYGQMSICYFCEIANVKIITKRENCKNCIINDCLDTFAMTNQDVTRILFPNSYYITIDRIAAAEAERIEFHEAIIELLTEHLKTLQQ